MNKQEFFYLKKNVYVEPLVNNWYAWTNLIAPITYSMYMSKTHRRLLNSFIKNHELHAIATKDNTLTNIGEFVECSKDELDDAKKLLNDLVTEHSIYIEIADAIKDLDDLLKGHKSGESIEPLYTKIPKPLKGYIELFMDLYHQPSYRLIEGLLYKSSYYNTKLQSVKLGILNKCTDRSSVISTPRFINDVTINIQEPFSSSLWDSLFATREHPIDTKQIEVIFNRQKLTGGLEPIDLFTNVVPDTSYKTLDHKDVRVQYLGHAGLFVETKSTKILIDPIIPYRTDETENKVISFNDILGKIDYICLTHNHSDHISIETLLQLRYKTHNILVPKNNGGTLADPSLKLILKNLNFNVYEMEDLEEIHIDAGKIVSIPFLGEHGDLNIRSKTAWFIKLHDKSIFAGADSSNLDSNMFKHIHAFTQDIDILAIGMECVGAPYTWLYGALNTQPVHREISKSRRLNGADFEKSKGMVEIFNPKHVLIYALGLEKWYQYLIGLSYSENAQQIVESDKLVQFCNSKNIPACRLEEKYEITL
jgi:L-ascorbate metabolism protein UlaG (beta-lactamase superfamily)